eukprot:g4978.t2
MLQNWPRGPQNGLHAAAFVGSAKRTADILSRQSADIDQGDLEGWTPLMIAARDNHQRVVKVLLENGANLSVVADMGNTALILAAMHGHAAVVKLLVEAGANMEDRDCDGLTALHQSSYRGHPEVMKVLLEAGARVDIRLPDGATSLYLACETGQGQAARVLLEAGTNPLLAPTSPSGQVFLPLDMACQNGHIGIVRDMLGRFGIKGCGGPSGGVDALHFAAQDQRIDVMMLLTEVGVVDTGEGLIAAIGRGRVASVKFLLQQREVRRTGGDDVKAYVNNARDGQGQTPAYRCVLECPQAAPRILQRLVEAGADVASPVPVLIQEAATLTLYTPLGLTDVVKCKLKGSETGGKGDLEEKLNTLEAVRRLLMRVEALRATSWLWASGSPVTVQGHTAQVASASTALTSLLPIMRRRAARRVVLLAPVFRYSAKRSE